MEFNAKELNITVVHGAPIHALEARMNNTIQSMGERNVKIYDIFSHEGAIVIVHSNERDGASVGFA